MDEITSRLRHKLEDSLTELSDEQIATLIKEARDEALAEAKAIIKRMVVQAILERALGELEGTRGKAVLVTSSREGQFRCAQRNRREQGSKGAEELMECSPAPLHLGSSAQTEGPIRHEIEAIRRRIAENERLLTQMADRRPPTLRQPFDAAQDIAADCRPVNVSELRTADDGEGGDGEDGYYVYGIVGGDGSQLEGLPVEGIDPAHPVYVLPVESVRQPSPDALPCNALGISAIVSKVSLHEFGQEALKANLNDIKWVEAKVLAHQRVLEAVLTSHTLIPMRFCTIYRSESGVREILVQHCHDFVEALAHLEGKQEWGIKVYCDGKILAQRIGEISDKAKELQAEMEQKSSGAAYFLKKKMDVAIAEEVERVSDEYAQRSHDRLSSHAKGVVINPLQSRELTDRKEVMVLNGAYLVAEEQLADFRAELESLSMEYRDFGFIFEMTGPWPPYNFVGTCTEPSRSIGLEESVAHE